MMRYTDPHGVVHEVANLTALWNPHRQEYGVVRVHATNCAGCGLGPARAIMDRAFCDMVERAGGGKQWPN